jgi:hypothetical protein
VPFVENQCALKLGRHYPPVSPECPGLGDVCSALGGGQLGRPFSTAALCPTGDMRPLFAHPFSAAAAFATLVCTRYNGSVSVAFHGKDKDLAGMNEIWIPDPVSVCPVHDRVSCAVAIGYAADAPQAVATGYDLGQIPGCNCRRGYAFLRH